MRYIERFQNTSQKHQVFKEQDKMMVPEKNKTNFKPSSFLGAESQGPKPELQGQRFSVKGQIQTQSVKVKDWYKQCSRGP